MAKSKGNTQKGNKQKGNKRYYVFETQEPFITMEKIFYSLEDAIKEADKSNNYSGVVEGTLVYMR